MFDSVARAVHFIGRTAVGIVDPGKGLAHLIHPAADAGQSFQHRVGSFAICREVGLALGRDAVKLPGTLLLHACVPDLVKKGESRINHSRTRSVETTRTLLECFDELITVCGALGEERQD
jgi:hypothetical protein